MWDFCYDPYRIRLPLKRILPILPSVLRNSTYKSQYFNNANAPDGIYIEQNPQNLRITRTWAKIAGYVMFAWVAVWFGLWSFFLSLGQQSAGWFILIPVLPGLMMAYAALARFLNHTIIEINSSRLIVKHAPLFWFGSKKFAVRDILKLEPQIKKVYAKQGIIHIYRILIVHKNGKKAIMLSGLEMTGAQMIFIIEAINTYSGFNLN
jgi:hypothetical protein